MIYDVIILKEYDGRKKYFFHVFSGVADVN